MASTSSMPQLTGAGVDHERGDYDSLYAALRHWLATEFPFWRPYYSNREIPR